MPKYRCHVIVQLAVELEAESKDAARDVVRDIIEWPDSLTMPPAEKDRPDGGHHVILSRDGRSLRLDLPFGDIHEGRDITFKKLIDV